MAMEDSAENSPIIVKYECGTATEEELQETVDKIWRDALSDTETKNTILEILRAEEGILDKHAAPFNVRIRGAGISGAEVLVVVATSFIIDFAGGLGETVGRRAGKESGAMLLRLWDFLFRRSVTDKDRVGEQLASESNQSE